MPDLEAWQWLLGGLSAVIIGIAKTGVPGIGTFMVPLMILTVGDARYAAAWTVVMLITGDIVAVTYWHRQAQVRTLVALIPWVAAGMALGAVALALPELTLRRIVGTTVLAMIALSLLQRRRRVIGGGHASLYGVPAGFATTVANAAGPMMNLYLLARRLPKEQFVATGAWFFLVVNVSKIPIYIGYGLFSVESLTFDLAMVPLVLTGGVAGVWLIRRIPQRIFDTSVLLLTLIASVALFL